MTNKHTQAMVDNYVAAIMFLRGARKKPTFVRWTKDRVSYWVWEK